METTLDLHLDPAPVAMLWREPGVAHEAVTVPTVALAPGDALVAIELATICGSDVHTTQGHRGAPTPLVLGHEQVGRVVAVGPGAVTADGAPLAPGTRVVWSLTVGCGACEPCGRGLPQKCTTVRKYGHERFVPGWQLSGGFATHVHVRAGTAIVPVSPSLPAEVLAPVSCGTATAAAAIDAAEQTVDLDGRVLVVFGAGLIGLTVAAMAADRGARVVVVDPDAPRRDLAARFGAAGVADPTLDTDSPGGVAHALGALTGGGAGSGTADGRPLVAIDASGSPRAVAAAIDLVGVGGVVVLVGSVFPSAPVALDAESIVRRLVTIRGVHNYAPRHLETAVGFVARRHDAYPFAALVGETVALADLDSGIEAAAGARSVRVGVRA